MHDGVRRKLIEVAKREETIAYGELMKEFSIPRGHRKPGIGIGYVVGEISEYEHQHGRPLLSVIVVRADSKTNICPKGYPSWGFFGLEGIPPNLRRATRVQQNPSLSIAEQEFVRREQERVWNYWRRHEMP